MSFGIDCCFTLAIDRATWHLGLIQCLGRSLIRRKFNSRVSILDVNLDQSAGVISICVNWNRQIAFCRRRGVDGVRNDCFRSGLFRRERGFGSWCEYRGSANECSDFGSWKSMMEAIAPRREEIVRNSGRNEVGGGREELRRLDRVREKEMAGEAAMEKVGNEVAEVGLSGMVGKSEQLVPGTKDFRNGEEGETQSSREVGKSVAGKFGRETGGEVRDSGMVGNCEQGVSGTGVEVAEIGKIEEGNMASLGNTRQIDGQLQRKEFGELRETGEEMGNSDFKVESKEELRKVENARDVGKGGLKLVGTKEVGTVGNCEGVVVQNPSELSSHFRDLGKEAHRKIPDLEGGVLKRSQNDTKSSQEGSEDVARAIVGEAETNNPHTGSMNICLVVAAKFPEDTLQYFNKLKDDSSLKLPDGTELFSCDNMPESLLGGDHFDISLFMSKLKTSQFGRLFLYAPRLPSTQTFLSQSFHSFSPGTLCATGVQYQGKGRAGNVWESPPGCLMFSYTLKMTSGRLIPFLQYVVSLAVVEAVEDICFANHLPTPELKIKWPNDLYANGKKVGGVLCTSTYSNKTFNIVTGVGLNVGNREPTTCLDELISELDGQAKPLKQEELLAAIMYKFEKLNTVFSEQGFLPLQSSYYQRWLHSGHRVILEERETSTANISEHHVTIQGLTPNGYLLAIDDFGEEYELHPDGNSFDFLKGLVRKKIS